MNTEHVDVGPDHSDTQVAEIFLHHRVLIVPVVDHGRVTGVITRATSSARSPNASSALRSWAALLRGVGSGRRRS